MNLSYVHVTLIFVVGLIMSQSTIYQLCWDRSKQGLIFLAQGHDPVMLVRLEPVAPLLQVKVSTTEPLRMIMHKARHIKGFSKQDVHKPREHGYLIT